MGDSNKLQREIGEIMREKVLNLTRLCRTNILMNFIKQHKGSWNDQEWLDFCAYLEKKGYAPIDCESVGKLLERKKRMYLNKTNMKALPSKIHDIG